MKTLITAHELIHAEYYAREVLHIGRSQFVFIKNNWDIRGFRGMELIIVNSPCYRPTTWQREMAYLIHVTAVASGLTIKEVTLT